MSSSSSSSVLRVGDSLPPGALPTHLERCLGELSPAPSTLLDLFALALDALMRDTGFSSCAPATRGDSGRMVLFEYVLFPDREGQEGTLPAGRCRLRVYTAGPMALVYGTFIEPGLDSYRPEQTHSYLPSSFVVDASPETPHHRRYANLRELRRCFVDEVALRMVCHACDRLDLPWPVGHITQLPEPALRAIFLRLGGLQEVGEMLRTCKAINRMDEDATLWKALCARCEPKFF